jgi:hypothetical protein
MKDNAMYEDEFSSSSSSESEMGTYYREMEEIWQARSNSVLTQEDIAKFSEEAYDGFMDASRGSVRRRDCGHSIRNYFDQSCYFPISTIQERLDNPAMENKVIRDLICGWQTENILFDKYLTDLLFEGYGADANQAQKIMHEKARVQKNILHLQQAKMSITGLPGGNQVLIQADQVNVAQAQQINNNPENENDGTEEK